VNKRRRIAVVVGLVVTLAGAWWVGWHSREPEYQGRPLSFWLRRMESSPDLTSTNWQTAVHALQQIGTKALPGLIASLQARDPNWKIEAVDWVREVLNRDLSHRLAVRDRQRALMAFQALGPIARPAIPTLAAMITNAKPDQADAGFQALSGIGVEECVPPLVLALTNGDAILRPAAAVSLGSLRGRAREAVPALLITLQSPDANLQIDAIRALGLIATNPRLAVPGLIRALDSTNAQVRQAAALAVGAFGTEAAAALPALRSLPPATEEFVRRGIARSLVRVQCEMREGGIIRGPTDERRLALVFTGHEFAEGGEVILDELGQHGGHGSFFVTGDFLRNPRFSELTTRIVTEGHYLGPHSDKHLLYCPWDNANQTLVSEAGFTTDLFANLRALPEIAWARRRASRYFLPAFEHYNRDIADWARARRWNLINYTPGTRSNADYTGEADKNFVSSQVIFDSILKCEAGDPRGLNGFILLLHLGSGPGRADKFSARFGELLDRLAAKGYRFVRVDELLEPKREEPGNEYSVPIRR